MSRMPPVSKDCLNGPGHYFEEGLRKVEPYFDNKRCTIKAKHYPGVGTTVLDYFVLRFPQFPKQYFELHLANNRIAVNTEVVGPDYVLQEDDVLTYLVHTHENDIFDLKVDIVYESEDIVVVDKPSSWPVYPIGNFRYNSLIYILMKEYGYTDLRPIHRIDAPTSGCAILAKKHGVSGKLQNHFRSRNTKKEYLALVDGKFFDTETVCEDPLDSFKISPRRLMRITGEKSAKTIFNLLSYHQSTNTSLVSCVPVTGRTHQIRLHLQNLGYFIVNDYLYNERDYEEERTDLNKEKLLAALANMEIPDKEPGKILFNDSFTDKLCLKCLNKDIFPPSTIRTMCLHSLKYTLGDLSFECALPSWAENPESARNSGLPSWAC